MATDRLKKTEFFTPLREGEFRRINGIAEATETRLRASGITTFDQLASLSPEEIAAVLPGQVGVKERAARQDWIGQARGLAQALEKDGKPQEFDVPTERQYYESFLVELLLEDDNAVRRTRVTNVRDGKKESWAGWEPGRLANWMQEEAHLAIQEPSGLFSAVPRTLYQVIPPSPKITGILGIGSCEMIHPRLGQPRHFFLPGEKFDLLLPLDVTQVDAPVDACLQYQVIIEAHRLGGSARKRLAEAKGELPIGPQLTLRIPTGGLPEGQHRLEIAVSLFLAGSSSQEGLHATAEGELVHIFAPQTV